MPYNISDTGPAAYHLQQQSINQEKLQNLIRLVLSNKQQQQAQGNWQAEQALRQQQFGLQQQDSDWQKQYQTGELGVRADLAKQSAAKDAFLQQIDVAKLLEEHGKNKNTVAYQEGMNKSRERANDINASKERANPLAKSHKVALAQSIAAHDKEIARLSKIKVFDPATTTQGAPPEVQRQIDALEEAKMGLSGIKSVVDASDEPMTPEQVDTFKSLATPGAVLNKALPFRAAKAGISGEPATPSATTPKYSPRAVGIPAGSTFIKSNPDGSEEWASASGQHFIARPPR